MATQTATAQSAVEQAKQSVIAYNDKNWEACRQAFTSDVVYDEVAMQRRLEGADAILTAWKAWATALPDSKATFERAFASDEAVTLELRWRGTHNGPLNLPSGKLEATGRAIDIRACQIIEMKDGKARAIRHYFDVATMVQQLGANK